MGGLGLTPETSDRGPKAAVLAELRSRGAGRNIQLGPRPQCSAFGHLRKAVVCFFMTGAEPEEGRLLAVGRLRRWLVRRDVFF